VYRGATSTHFLNPSRDGDSPTAPSSLVQRLTALFSKEIFPNIQSEPPLTQLEAVSSHPIEMRCGKSQNQVPFPGGHSLATMCQEQVKASGCSRVSPGSSGPAARGTGNSTRVLFIKLPAPGVGLLTLPSGDYRCHPLTGAPSLAANDVLWLAGCAASPGDWSLTGQKLAFKDMSWLFQWVGWCCWLDSKIWEALIDHRRCWGGRCGPDATWSSASSSAGL